MGLSSGTMLGSYKIQSPPGTGGEVYRACGTRLDRTVAGKILPWCLSSNPEDKQRFDRGACTVSSLSHPNVCHLSEVGAHDGSNYLDMDH